MGLTCFVSHNANEEERVFVYRLQTLATSSGIRVMLPHRIGPIVSDETRSRIAVADLFIAILTATRGAHVHHEIGIALALNKPIVAIYRKGARPQTIGGIHWISYDPLKGFASVEQQVMRVLQDKLTEKESRQGALVAILGLTLLALLTQQSSKK